MIGAQYSAVRPAGMKKKTGRMAPVIEEQARQGIATQMVSDAKARQQANEEWAFQKSAREQELKNQKQQMKMQKKAYKHQKNMGYLELGIGAVSTAFNAIDALSDWFG